MPTSELSDALNPNVVRPRNYDDVLVYQDIQAHSNFHHQLNLPYEQPSQQPQYEYVPHRSELELAVVEPTLPQRYFCMILVRLHCNDEFTANNLPPLIIHGRLHGSWPS